MFWFWILLSIIHSLILYYGTYFAIPYGKYNSMSMITNEHDDNNNYSLLGSSLADGKTTDLLYAGNTIFTVSCRMM